MNMVRARTEVLTSPNRLENPLSDEKAHNFDKKQMSTTSDLIEKYATLSFLVDKFNVLGADSQQQMDN